MNITEFKTSLLENPEKKIRFLLPSGKAIPPQFHITEVGHLEKTFMDCGHTKRSASSCLLQAWVAANDEEHSLLAGKLGHILGLAEKILPSEELSVEVEYESPYISQFPIASLDIQTDALVFQLTTKHTDCLAKEQCGLESGSSCCSNDDGPCGT